MSLQALIRLPRASRPLRIFAWNAMQRCDLRLSTESSFRLIHPTSPIHSSAVAPRQQDHGTLMSL